MKSVFGTLLQKPWLWLIILFIIAAFARLSYLGNIEFKQDEAVLVYQAYTAMDNHQLPLVSTYASIGISDFPLSLYMLILFSSLRQSPQFLSAAIALLNVVAICLFYFLLRKFYQRGAVLSASLLLALAPWSILLSRKIWQPDMLLCFAVPFLYFLHRIIYLHDRKSYIWLACFGILLIQIHDSGIFFVLIALLYLLRNKMLTHYFSLIKGVCLGILPALPYIYYQFFSGPFCRDCTALSRQYIFDIFHFVKPFELFSMFSFDFELGKSYDMFLHFNSLISPMIAGGSLSIFFLVVGIFVLMRNKKHGLLLYYFILFPLFCFISGITSYIHYYTIMLPIIALLMGIGLTSLVQGTRNKLLKCFFLCCFAFLLIVYVTFTYFFNTFLQAYPSTQGDYGTIFSSTNSLVRKQLQNYTQLPYYKELNTYAFIYVYKPNFHAYLGDYFQAADNQPAAIHEYLLNARSHASP